MGGYVKKNQVAILVVSCDKYNDVWNIFFKTFKKYWPDCPYPIYLGTNKITYFCGGVNLINTGEDLSYSENLIMMMDKVEAEHLIIWVDDLMLTAPVNTQHIKDIVEYAIKSGIDFVKLLPNFPYSYTEEKYGIGRLPNGIKYQVSIGLSCVKKSFMKSIVAEKKKSAWDLEYEISRNIKNRTDLKIYALLNDLKNYPISYKNIIGKGKVIRNSASFIIENGGAEIVSKRGLQSLRDYAYYRTYLFFLWTLKKLNLYWRL